MQGCIGYQQRICAPEALITQALKFVLTTSASVRPDIALAFLERNRMKGSTFSPKSCSSNFSQQNGLFNDQKQAFGTDFLPLLDEKCIILLLCLRYVYVIFMCLTCFLFLYEFSACSVVVRSAKNCLTANVKLQTFSAAREELALYAIQSETSATRLRRSLLQAKLFDKARRAPPLEPASSVVP